MAWCPVHGKQFAACMEYHLPPGDGEPSCLGEGTPRDQEILLQASMERHPSGQEVYLSPEMEALVDNAVARMERDANQYRQSFREWLARLSDAQFTQVVDVIHEEYLRRLSQGHGGM